MADRGKQPITIKNHHSHGFQPPAPWRQATGQYGLSCRDWIWCKVPPSGWGLMQAMVCETPPKAKSLTPSASKILHCCPASKPYMEVCPGISRHSLQLRVGCWFKIRRQGLLLVPLWKSYPTLLILSTLHAMGLLTDSGAECSCEHKAWKSARLCVHWTHQGASWLCPSRDHIGTATASLYGVNTMPETNVPSTCQDPTTQGRKAPQPHITAGESEAMSNLLTHPAGPRLMLNRKPGTSEAKAYPLNRCFTSLVVHMCHWENLQNSHT